MSRNYWWASHWGDGYDLPKEGSYICGPLEDVQGVKKSGFANLGKLKPGDVIFHAPVAIINSISRVTGEPVKKSMPAPLAKHYRRGEGWICEVEYFDLEDAERVSGRSVPTGLENEIPKWLRASGKTGVYASNGQIKGGLLKVATEYLVDELKKLFPDIWPPGCPLVESD